MNTLYIRLVVRKRDELLIAVISLQIHPPELSTSGYIYIVIRQLS